MKEIPRHIPVLDSLRCLAAVSVCLFHAVSTTIGFVRNEEIKSAFSIGAHGVEVFFVISGFIIPWSIYKGNYCTSDFFRYMKKRLARIYPPYLFAVAAALAFIFLRSFGPNYNGIEHHPTFMQISLHLGFLIPFFEGQHWLNPVFWTLAIEMEFYILIGMTFSLFKSNSLIERGIGYLIFLIPGFLPYWGVASIQNYLSIFLLGILVFLFFANKIKLAEMIPIAIIAVISIYIKMGFIVLCASLIPFILILFFPSFDNPIGKFVGKISYSLYLIHTLTGTAFVNYFAHFETGPFEKILIVIAGLLLSVFAAWVMFIIIEKPSMKLVSGIKLKKENSQV